MIHRYIVEITVPDSLTKVERWSYDQEVSKLIGPLISDIHKIRDDTSGGAWQRIEHLQEQ